MRECAYQHLCVRQTVMDGLDDLRPLARMLDALADERRLRIVALLSRGALCVCHFEAALDMPQPEVSRQLAILRQAGVVSARREQRWVYYQLATQTDPACSVQLKQLARQLGNKDQIRKDVERLLKTRGPMSCK